MQAICDVTQEKSAVVIYITAVFYFNRKDTYMNEFNRLHPIVNFTYFFAVLGFTMFFMHPTALVISLISGFTYSVILNGKRAMHLLYLLPIIIFTALVNPLFNHEGLTVLAYLPDGNPLTLESVIYGISAATVLASMICHFSCFNSIITSDKFIYLFGKTAPSLSLIFTMVLRFVPRFKTELKAVSDAQKGIGMDITQGNIINRTKNTISVLSVMLTRSLENSIDTADSMKSRGYGLPKRTSYSNFRLSKHDIAALIYIVILSGYIISGSIHKALYFSYFPKLEGTEISWLEVSVFAAYLLLFTYPIMIEIWEALKWKKLKSKI